MSAPVGGRPERPATRRRRVIDALRWILAVVTLLVLMMGFVTARFFLWPGSDAPGRADAIVVLSGDHGERLPVALRLVQAGVAPVLVLDGEPDLLEVVELCKGGAAFEVVCLRPDPDGTRPEARSAAALAAARHWKAMVVVTSTQHGTRAGLLFRRCFPGSVKVVRARPPFDAATTARQVAREVAATTFLLTIGPRSC